MMKLSGQLLCCLPHSHILKSIDSGSLIDLGALAELIRISHATSRRPTGPAVAS